jgi:hypothetical protein
MYINVNMYIHTCINIYIYTIHFHAPIDAYRDGGGGRHTYVYMYIYLSICICIYIFIYTYIPFISMPPLMLIGMEGAVGILMYICISIYMYMHIYIYIHIYTIHFHAPIDAYRDGGGGRQDELGVLKTK